MPISIEEFEKHLERCYELKSAMQNAEDQAAFDKNQTELRQLAEKLSSSSGEYYPSLPKKPENDAEARSLISASNALQHEAKDLLKFSVFTRFGVE